MICLGRNKKDKVLKNGIWKSAVAFDAQAMAFTFRSVLEELGIDFERDTEHKHYQKYMAGFVPIPRFAYVFEFKIDKPEKFVIKLYDTQPTHSGILHIVEIDGLTEKNFEEVGRILRKVTETLPRKPWKFFWGERFRYALLAPEYLKARGNWRIFDIQ